MVRGGVSLKQTVVGVVRVVGKSDIVMSAGECYDTHIVYYV